MGLRTTLKLVLLAAILVGLGAFGLASCGVADLDLAGKACPCTTGFVCDTTQNVCVAIGDASADAVTVVDGSSSVDATPGCPEAGCPCSTDAQCTDPAFPKCDNMLCVECTIADDRCPAGRYCTAADVCTVGCKADSECATLSPSAPFCDLTRRQCIQCKGDGNCTGGQKCSPAGTCADACATEAGACTGGKECCSGFCIDTKSDVLNCNGCGTPCTGAQTLCCGGTCTDPATTAASCGGCGAACSTLNGTPSCTNGNCGWACDTGFGHCQTGNTGCETNTTTTTNHCGSCFSDCNKKVANATGISCVASACTYATCVSPYSDCNGFKSDGCECAPCGTKGQPCCSPGNTCVMGLTCQGTRCDD